MDWKRILIGKWSWKRPFQSLLSIYLLLGIVAVFFADRIIFVAPGPSYPKELKGLIHLTTDAGERVAALHYPAAIPRFPARPFPKPQIDPHDAAAAAGAPWRER